jgi:large subunit ribosomal protein L16
MLQPRKLKHRKWQKGKRLKRKVTTKGCYLAFSDYGLKSLEAAYIKDKHIETCLKEMKRILGKKGRVWSRVFPHLTRTKKPEGTRMGGGKGDIDHYVVLVKPGTILFEVEGKDKNLIISALRSASYKLPIKTKIVTNE